MLFPRPPHLWPQGLAFPAQSHPYRHLVRRRRYDDRYLKLDPAPRRHKIASVASPPWSSPRGKILKTKVVSSGGADKRMPAITSNGSTSFSRKIKRSAAEPRTPLPFQQRDPAQTMPYVFQIIVCVLINELWKNAFRLKGGVYAT